MHIIIAVVAVVTALLSQVGEQPAPEAAPAPKHHVVRHVHKAVPLPRKRPVEAPHYPSWAPGALAGTVTPPKQVEPLEFSLPGRYVTPIAPPEFSKPGTYVAPKQPEPAPFFTEWFFGWLLDGVLASLIIGSAIGVIFNFIKTVVVPAWKRRHPGDQ